MAQFRGSLPDVFDDRQALLFFKEFKAEPLLYQRAFNVKDETKGHVDAFRVSTLGTFRRKFEGAPITYDDAVQGPRLRVIISTFALGYRVTMEAQRDAQYDVIDQMPSDLGDAGRHHIETLTWGLPNDGFAGATYTGLDGLALYSASHTSLKGAGLRSNRITPGVQLSVSLMEDMVTNLRTTLSDAGRQTPITPSMLIIHPSEAHEAARILESEFEPNTSENQINVMRGSRTGITPLDVPYLTDQDAVHLWAAKGKHSVNYHNRQSMEFDNSTDTQTKDRLYDGVYRGQVAFWGWEGTVGSQP